MKIFAMQFELVVRLKLSLKSHHSWDFQRATENSYFACSWLHVCDSLLSNRWVIQTTFRMENWRHFTISSLKYNLNSRNLLNFISLEMELDLIQMITTYVLHHAPQSKNVSVVLVSRAPFLWMFTSFMCKHKFNC